MFRRDLGNNLSSILRPSGTPWFKVRTGMSSIDKKPENLRWLDNATSILRRHHYHAKSGTTRALKEGDHDFVTFGNAVISNRARPGKAHLTSRCHHMSDVAWLENDDGEVNHLQLRRKMYVRDVLARWPAKVPAKLKIDYERDPSLQVMTRNIACPFDEYFGHEGASKPAGARVEYVSIWCLPDHMTEFGALGPVHAGRRARNARDFRAPSPLARGNGRHPNLRHQGRRDRARRRDPDAAVGRLPLQDQALRHAWR